MRSLLAQTGMLDNDRRWEWLTNRELPDLLMFCKVIVRLSDFKSNEYASLLGGSQFEPHEHNPMLGWRGASRYYHQDYRAGFALECRAMKKVKYDLGLDNLVLMVPFVRTLDEGRRVIQEMKNNGLELKSPQNATGA
jgi:phosphoenolpyruvate synthase/pyruvate phosphate dikinase